MTCSSTHPLFQSFCRIFCQILSGSFILTCPWLKKSTHVIFNHQQMAELTHVDWNTPICSWSSSPAALSSWRTWLASWCCTQVHPPEPADWPWIRACQRVECKALENHVLRQCTYGVQYAYTCASLFSIMSMVTSRGGVIVDIMLTLTLTFLLSVNT